MSRIADAHEARAMAAIDRLDADAARQEMRAAETAYIAEAWQRARGRDRLEILADYFTLEM